MTLTRCFYAGLFYIVLLSLDAWSRYRDRPAFDLLWPLSWLDFFDDVSLPLNILGALFLLGGLMGVMAPEWRSSRILAFVGLFFFDVLRNSFGSIGHSFLVWVLVAFVLIFLPTGWGRRTEPSRLEKEKFLLVFWCAQAMFLLTYSMSGFGKVLGIVDQIWAGEVSGLAPEALAIHTADRLLETGSDSIAGKWLVAHPWWGWLPMLSILYVQFFSIWIAFRPSLQSLWAIALIGFHLGSYLIMTIHFPRNAFLLALFFLRSPFEPSGIGWRERIEDLPILGIPLRRWGRS